MTPVEERIDHEEAKRIAGTLLTFSMPGEDGRMKLNLDSVQALARAYLDLHVGYEAFRTYERCVSMELPATESAQPEEEG